MNATLHQLPANDPQSRPILHVLHPPRFVLIEVFCQLTGYTKSAVENKIAKGIWIEGRHWKLREGRRHMDLEAYDKWVAEGV